MTRANTALRIGAASLLAGSLIFTSFQTFAEEGFDTGWNWETSEQPTVVAEETASFETEGATTYDYSAPVEETSSAFVETDTPSQWGGSAETTNEEGSFDESFPTVTSEISEPVTSWNEDMTFIPSEEEESPIARTVDPIRAVEPSSINQNCRNMMANASQSFDERMNVAGARLELCLRASQMPCRGDRCAPSEASCYTAFDRERVNAESSYSARLESIIRFCGTFSEFHL